MIDHTGLDPLLQIDITAELARRSSRPPDHASESKALVRLARLMTESPEQILHELATTALTLCNGGSAGISIAEAEEGKRVFRWAATAGKFAPLLGSTMPRDFSPCGIVVDRNAPQLMADPARCFDYITSLGRPIPEVLLVPFHRSGVAIGTIWVVSHTDDKKFDAEDQRILESLGKFASAVTQTLDSFEEQKRVEKEFRAAEERLRLATDAAGLAIFKWHLADDRVDWENDRPYEIFEIPRSDGPIDVTRFRDEFLHEGDAEILSQAAAATVEEGKQFYFLGRFKRPSGEIRWLELTGQLLRDVAGRPAHILGTAADVTKRKRCEEATQLRALQLQKLASISLRISAAHDIDSVLSIVTEEVRDLIGAHQSVVGFTIDDTWAQAINHVSLSDKYAAWRSFTAKPDGTGIYSIVCRMNRPMRMTQAELESHPAWKKFGGASDRHPPMRGWLAAPLTGRDGKNVGLLQLSDKFEGDFTADDEALLVQLAQMSSVAVANARLYQELRTNDERKDEFLAMLAHELRNPLAAIGNAVKLTSTTDDRGHIDWSMEVISRQTRHLARLIDDLMDVSRITRGKIELRRDVMDLTPILESAAATVMTLVEERKHTLELDIDRGNLWAKIDPTRLEQVVVNLLNNSAKYSENAGHILLSARSVDSQIVISVKDQGVGIAAEKLPEMFELFAQGDRSLARSEGGLGIGLTVVKKLVEMHGGAITAKSEGLGKGSEFIIRLPVATRLKPQKTRSLDPKLEARKVKILVVDDNVDTARGMARLLKIIGHDVTTAHDGLEAIEVAREHRPDFVLLDIGLPGMSGYEVAAQLRQDECCRDAVIVAVSGYGQDEDRRRSKQAGFDFHLVKPLDHDALLVVLAGRVQ